MGFPCVPQILALAKVPRQRQIKDKKTGQKKSAGRSDRRASGDKILKEMAEERASQSETLDKNKSYLNVYDEENYGRSGSDAWQKMVEQADAYTKKVVINGETRERHLNEHQIIGVSVLIKPPAEVVNSWSPEYKKKFFEDAQEVLEEYDPILRKENRTFTAFHNDEAGGHLHQAFNALEKNGEYGKASRVETVKWLDGLNQFFPEEMRKRGHAVDNIAPAYSQNYEDEKDRGGQSTNDYIKNRSRKYAKETVKQADVKAKQIKKDAENSSQELLNQTQAECTQMKEETSAECVAWEDEAEKFYADKMNEAEEETKQIKADNLARTAKVQEREKAVDEREKAVEQKEQDLNQKDSALSDLIAEFKPLIEKIKDSLVREKFRTRVAQAEQISSNVKQNRPLQNQDQDEPTP